MKKLLALAAVAVMALGAHADETLAVGGNLTVWHNQSADVTTVSIMPELDYTFNEHWGVGTAIGYKYVGNGDVNNHSFVLAPYSRYTFFRQGIVGLFCDGGFDLALGSTSYKGGDTTKTSAAFSIGFRPGISIAASENVSLVAHFGFLGYQGCNDAAGAAGYTKGYGFNFSNGVDFGFYYSF